MSVPIASTHSGNFARQKKYSKLLRNEILQNRIQFSCCSKVLQFNYIHQNFSFLQKGALHGMKFTHCKHATLIRINQLQTIGQTYFDLYEIISCVASSATRWISSVVYIKSFHFSSIVVIMNWSNNYLCLSRVTIQSEITIQMVWFEMMRGTHTFKFM